MNTLRAAPALFLSFVFASAAASAPAAQAQSFPSDDAIRQMARERVDSARAVGVVVGILENGERRYFAYGSAGEGLGPVDERTIFEIGSVSKLFTALLLADAAVRGEVRLERPVAELLPRGTVVPARDGLHISLEHLATHRSGLPRLPDNLIPPDLEDPYRDYSWEMLRAFLASHSLEHAPGTHSEYSNLGAGLLGHALAHRAGTSWDELVRLRITGPLGMDDTHMRVPEAARGRLAAGHDPTLHPAAHWHFDALAGAGALRSTAADLLTFLAAALETGAGPLAPALALTRQPRAPFGGDHRMALGWVVRGADESPILWHDGGTGGFASYVAIDPVGRRAVVVLANAAVPVQDLGLHLLDPSSALRMPRVPPRQTTVTLSAAELDRVVGEYPLAPTFVLAITREEDRVYVQATGQPRLRIWPSAPDRFFLREVEAELEFHFGADGRATAVTLHQGGASQRAERRP